MRSDRNANTFSLKSDVHTFVAPAIKHIGLMHITEIITVSRQT